MLKRKIKYTDFNDEEHEEVFYFNLSKTEVMDLELSPDGGYANMLQRIIEAQDTKAIIDTFKTLILSAYGERSEDGKRFRKSEEISHNFSEHAAYQALFMELGTNDVAAAEFILGVFPQDMVDESGVTPAQLTAQAKQMVTDTKGPDGLSG